MTKEIIKENGFGSKGLNKGVFATIGRNGVFNMIYFGFYHSVKGFFAPYEVCIMSYHYTEIGFFKTFF